MSLTPNNLSLALIQFANNLCFKLAEALFIALKDDIKEDPSIETKCLGIMANFLLMSSGTFQYKDEHYKNYVINTCIEIGYNEKDVEQTMIFKHGMELRKLFRADDEFLKSEEKDLNRGPLPSTKDIKDILGAKFAQLGHIFREAYNNKLTTETEKFIKEKIAEILVLD